MVRTISRTTCRRTVQRQTPRSVARLANEQFSDKRCDQSHDLQTNNIQRHQVAVASRRLWSLTLATSKRTGP
ncbi:hypothetical protein Bca4012_057077 [Brassica carinata]